MAGHLVVEGYENPKASKSDWIGERVKIPTHYDAWMRGARYGVVTAYRAGKAGQSAYLSVKMDHPGIKKPLKLWEPDWNYAEFLGKDASVSGAKNPTKKKRATKRAAPKKRVTARKNPTRSNTAPKKYLVRATTNGGKVYYFTGFSLTSFKRDAARYPDASHAQKTMEHVEDAMSNGLKRANVKHLDIIQA